MEASGVEEPVGERWRAEGKSVKNAVPGRSFEGLELVVVHTDPFELAAVGLVAVGGNQVLVAEKVAQVQVNCWCWGERESWGCLC